MEISTYAIIIWITAIFIVSLDIVILVGSKNISSRVFTFFSFITAIWVFSQGFFISITDPSVANVLIRIQYTLGIIIALGFYHFSKIYPYNKIPSKKSVIISSIIIIIFFYLYIFTDHLTSGIYYTGKIGRWGWYFGEFNLLFDLLFYLLWSISLYKLYSTYRKSSGLMKINLKNMFLALFLGIIPPTLANILLPSFGIYDYNWIGPITSFIWISIIAYSIIRYNQMNVKAIVTEVLALCMTIVYFINIFTEEPLGIIGRVVTFIVFLILAIYLLQSTLRESRQKEELANLNLSLSQKVAEQTKEIMGAYELEKKARRDLEKLNETKDQFIMITQHNLRTPATSIRWEIESMLSGDHGEISSEIKQTLVDTKSAVGHLTKIIDDFLNITALKIDSKILNITTGNIKNLLEEILVELKLDINKMHLSVNYDRSETNWPDLKIDVSKMKEVILIIIENAVRYNVQNGSIDITFVVINDTFKLKVKNTGIGICSQDRMNIIDKIFYRSKQAMSVNPIGMGIGLSVARAIVRGHHGDIEINSEGEGKGALVILELPMGLEY